MSKIETVWDDKSINEISKCVVCSKEVRPYAHCISQSVTYRPWLPVCLGQCKDQIVKDMREQYAENSYCISYKIIELWIEKYGNKTIQTSTIKNKVKSHPKLSGDELQEDIFKQIFG